MKLWMENRELVGNVASHSVFVGREGGFRILGGKSEIQKCWVSRENSLPGVLERAGAGGSVVRRISERSDDYCQLWCSRSPVFVESKLLGCRNLGLVI